MNATRKSSGFSHTIIENEEAYARATQARIRENARKGRGARWLTEDASRSEIVAFLNAKHGAAGFLGKMAEALNEWGSLSAGQEAAVRKIIAAETERKAKFDAEAAKSEYVGEIGKRATFELTAVAVTEIVNEYEGYSFWLHIFRAGDDKFVYRGKRLPVDKGETYKIKATPAAHTEYKGAKQTKISRPVVLGKL